MTAHEPQGPWGPRPGRPAVALTVAGIHVYPVKSCRGLALSEARLTPRGLAHDREWMVIRPDGVFVSQRQLPQMAWVETELTGTHLVLRSPGQPALEIPMAERHRSSREVQIWADRCPALDEGDAAAAWLTENLSTPLRLVRFLRGHRRLSNREWTRELEAGNAFSDGFPLTVLSEESLADLNRRIGGPALPMDRFRPNLVLRGGDAYVEDRTRRLTGDGIEIRLVKPCTRCRITTTDQATAEVGIEPLRTLATYRRDHSLDGVVFAQNAVIRSGVGQWVKVGMRWMAD